jgi:hypothetical protein
MVRVGLASKKILKAQNTTSNQCNSEEILKWSKIMNKINK